MGKSIRYSLKEYEEMHQKIFLIIYERYLAGIQVTHEVSDPEEVADHLAREASLVTSNYFEILRIVSKP